MSLVSAFLPSDSYRKRRTPNGEAGLVKQFWSAGQFLRGLRVQMRFGELTRAPLRLLRLQMRAEEVECDWVARALDPWDASLSNRVQQRHASLQTLRDAIDVRALLFQMFPQIETAHFRVYRESEDDEREMIVIGCTQRNDNTSREVHSLVMRAKVLGFRFDMEEERLRKLSTKGQFHAGNLCDSNATP
jgi:hypothetical protein